MVQNRYSRTHPEGAIWAFWTRMPSSITALAIIIIIIIIIIIVNLFISPLNCRRVAWNGCLGLLLHIQMLDVRMFHTRLWTLSILYLPMIQFVFPYYQKTCKHTQPNSLLEHSPSPNNKQNTRSPNGLGSVWWQLQLLCLRIESQS